ncbi:hypothetical protein Tco_0364343 [Tanacetum coccineum]
MSEAENHPPASSVTALRIPINKKGEYDLWCMKMKTVNIGKLLNIFYGNFTFKPKALGSKRQAKVKLTDASEIDDDPGDFCYGGTYNGIAKKREADNCTSCLLAFDKATAPSSKNRFFLNLRGFGVEYSSNSSGEETLTRILCMNNFKREKAYKEQYVTPPTRSTNIIPNHRGQNVAYWNKMRYPSNQNSASYSGFDKEFEYEKRQLHIDPAHFDQDYDLH